MGHKLGHLPLGDAALQAALATHLESLVGSIDILVNSAGFIRRTPPTHRSTPVDRAVTPKDVVIAVLACVTHLRTTTGTRIIIDSGQHL